MIFSAYLLMCLLMQAGISSAADSCYGRCDTSADFSYDCQCNTVCKIYGDCCGDYDSICVDLSCTDRCGEQYNRDNPCHCNDVCGDYGNCCSDYDQFCIGGELSCNGRCGESYNRDNPCHCNDVCGDYGNCCSDYDQFCKSGSDGKSLSELASTLWDADVNGLVVGTDFQVNKQIDVSSNWEDRVNNSPMRLFTNVQGSKLTMGTWPSFKALLNNYYRMTGQAESDTEDAEIEAFLDEIFKTEVMSLTYDYMKNKGFPTLTSFRRYIKDLWFTTYSRSGGTLDSSGFEHVFVGEVKNGKVSGYHNWLAFHGDESDAVVDYYGYTSEANPNQILIQFRLTHNGSNYYKELASLIYGASPELELALFTVCFAEKPNAICSFDMNGSPQRIQTWDYSGQDLIGSAYFSV